MEATRPSPARLVVLASGSGSNLQALVDACRDPAYGAVIAAVVSDRSDAFALERARAAAIPTHVVAVADHPDRQAWDRAMTATVARYTPDLVVSAGFMRLLGPGFLAAFPQRVVNTHPALLPAFPGAHAVRDALAYGAQVTGVTVHIVDEGIDTGPVIAQAAVPVLAADQEDSLHERIKSVERALLVEVVGRMVRDGYTVEGRKVVLL